MTVVIDGSAPARFMLFVGLYSGGRYLGVRSYCPGASRQTYLLEGGWVE